MTTYTMAEYLADPAPEPSLSSGLANLMITASPRHVWRAHPRLNPDHRPHESDAADIGTAAHELLLGGDSRLCEIDAEDWRTKAAKEARDLARSNGLTPILARKMHGVRAMATAARDFIADSDLGDAMTRGVGESTIIWEDDGAWCRCRPDWLTTDRDWMIHYKTTAGSAEPSAWIRNQLTSSGYDVAVAFYERGIRAEYGGFDGVSVFLVQEQAAPYACSLVGLDPMMMDLAVRKVERAISLWRECIEKNTWPGYDGKICYAEPTPWAMAEEEGK